MFKLFRVILDRIKALLVTQAVLEFETDFVIQHAERQAQLLRLAAGYEAEGMPLIAQHVRRQAETLGAHGSLVWQLPSLPNIANGTDRPEGLEASSVPAELPLLNKKPAEPQNPRKRRA